MRDKLLVSFNYNEQLKLKNYSMLFVGLVLLPIMIINNPVVALCLIVLIVIISLKLIVFNRHLISFFSNHIEINIGLFSGKQIINIDTIESIVPGQKTFVINAKLINKPIILALHNLNAADVVKFVATINKIIPSNDYSYCHLKPVKLTAVENQPIYEAKLRNYKSYKTLMEFIIKEA